MALSRTLVSPGPCSALRTATEVPRPHPGLPVGGQDPLADGQPLGGGQALCGGTANKGRVIRVGDTVRRPIAPCWRATHALLDHLAAVGFDGAPRVLEAGPAIEKLTYIEGKAAVPPLPEETLTDHALASVADLLSRYHRAVASFDPAGH